MPFDTTYYIKTYDENISSTLTLPGGKDTTIVLYPWQLPSELDSALSVNDAAVRNLQNSLAKDVERARHYTPDTGFILIFISVFSLIIYKAWRNSRSERTYSQNVFYKGEKNRAAPLLKYYGDELGFSDEELKTILVQRFPYYNRLSQDQKKVFIERLQKFIDEKTFKIHGEKGFKEMPVLISAAAIQLTFGLKKYLLPHFEFIHIHPQEFLRTRPILCFLEGNVSGHSINLSWKHFLDGYANPTDGQNVGLHELAHALYYQNFMAESNTDKSFRNLYDSFNVDGNKAYQTEKTVAGGLYSEYAEKNLQEFWAESAELFFEKPVEMESQYPQLYQTMRSLLNQDPVNNMASVGS